MFTIVVGSTSAAALPGAFLPWVLLPLTNERYTARVAALRSALIIPFMGGVNAASTLASLLPVGLYLLSRPRGPRQRKLIAWWVPGVILATAWWVVPLLMLGIYGENFLPYVESSQTTTDTMSATEALRGAGQLGRVSALRRGLAAGRLDGRGLGGRDRLVDARGRARSRRTGPP